MKYREQLPSGCPPKNAETIVNERSIYRLVEQKPPTIDDFKSLRAKNPDKKYSGFAKCKASGLSVHSSEQGSEKVRKLPRFRKHKICRVTLKSGAGKIQQTGKCSFHHTWWPFADFDILANCYIENSNDKNSIQIDSS